MDRKETYNEIVTAITNGRTFDGLLAGINLEYRGQHAGLAAKARPENLCNPGFHDHRTGFGGRMTVCRIKLTHGFSAIIAAGHSYYGGYPDPGYTIVDDIAERSAKTRVERSVRTDMTLEQFEALDRRPFGGVRIDPYSSQDKVQIVPVAKGASWGFLRDPQRDLTWWSSHRFAIVIPEGGDESINERGEYLRSWWRSRRVECARQWAHDHGVIPAVDLEDWNARSRSGKIRTEGIRNLDRVRIVIDGDWHTLEYPWSLDYGTPSSVIPALIVCSRDGSIVYHDEVRQYVSDWIARAIQAEAHPAMEYHKALFAA